MEVREETERLRREIARIKAKGGCPHFQPALRTEVVAWYQAQLSLGIRAEAACREIGLAANTLRRWAQEESGASARSSSSETTSAAFIPVTVASTTAMTLRVLGPAGLRIEGLDLTALAELLRRLA